VKDRHVDIDAYLDGVLEPGARAESAAHLAACAQCAQRLRVAERVNVAVAAQHVPDPGPAYWERFAARVESRLERRAPATSAYERLFGWLVPPGRGGALRAATAVAAACLLVYVGMRGFRPSDVRPRVGTPATEAPAPRTTSPAPVTEVAEPHVTPPSPPVPRPPAAEAPRRQAPAPTAAAPDERVLQAPVPEGVAAAPEPPALAQGTSPAAESVADEDAPRADLAKPGATATDSARPDVEPMVAFLVAQVAQAAAATASPEGLRPYSAPAPRSKALPQAQALPQPGDAGLGRWLELERQAWPLRDVPALRSSLATIARRLAPHAATDSTASARARALAQHLAATGSDAGERAFWESFVRSLP
jgi:hypothetical protein